MSIPVIDAAASTATQPGPPAPQQRITAADVMSTPVVAVSAHETLWEAWGLLYRSGFRHLVVVEGTRCVGVLDDRRIVTEWPLGPVAPQQRTVGDVVSRRRRIVVPTTPVADLARIMLEERIDAVPVVNDRGHVVGLVTASDLLELIARPTGKTTPPDVTEDNR